MLSKFKNFFRRFFWALSSLLVLSFIVQLALLSIKNNQIDALVQENAELRSSLDSTEEKIEDLIAIQTDIRIFQAEIDSWLKGINKGSLVKFSRFLAPDFNTKSINFASINPSLSPSTDFRLARLELFAHRARFDASSLLNKTLTIKDFMLKIPSLTPTTGLISSHFGSRLDPVTKKLTRHHGIDIAGPIGTPVFAPANGVVVTAKYSATFGNLIEIKHSHGFISRYGHLHDLGVKKGQEVFQGQRIGSIGTTGKSDGPHLHYEIRQNHLSLDPTQFMVLSSSANRFF